MKNKNMLITTITLAAIIGSTMLFKKIVQKKKTRFTIGILQTASHPALDAARNGFVEILKKEFGNEISFVVRNAEGSIPNMHTIAQHFHANTNIDGIFAIATPALQAMSSVEKEKPIMFAAVTDPSVLNVIHPKRNVCGSTDMIDVRKEIKTMLQLLPQVKTVGIIRKTGEINSEILAKKMTLELKRNNITTINVAISTEANISTAITSTLRKVDALIAPTDNMIASAINIITHLANTAGKPLIVSDNLLVKHGALMAQGVDYHESGNTAGLMAIDILANNKKPYEIPIAQPINNTVFVNKTVLDQLELSIPDQLKNQIKIVNTNKESS